MTGFYSMMIHGGAGILDHISSGQEAERHLESIRLVLEQGRDILNMGSTAMQAVETCASLLEDDPLFNAGRGSALNVHGKIEMDAAIMDGCDLSAGAVAGVSNIANPIRLARILATESEHVMLVGEGAMQFASKFGLEIKPDSYFVTEFQREQYAKAHAAHHVRLGYEVDNTDQKNGTIGAVAMDKQGNLAAATSTGGTINRIHGRVGDTPIIGAGVYADNQTCAVSATGYGEDIMRTVLAKYISNLIEFKNLDVSAAVNDSINYFTNKVNGRGGVIVIDKEGRCSSAFTTKTMVHGWFEHGGNIECAF